MKKKIAALLAAVTMFSTVSSVLATEFDAWSGKGSNYIDKAENVIIQSSCIHSGTGALQLTKGSGSTYGQFAIELKKGGKVSFWTRDLHKSWRNKVYLMPVEAWAVTVPGPFYTPNDGSAATTWNALNTDDHLIYVNLYKPMKDAANAGNGTFNEDNYPFRLVAEENGWQKWETNPWYTANNDFAAIMFKQQQNGASWYVDDVTVTNPDGSVYELNFDTNPELFGEGNVAYGVSVNTVGGTANLSWRNPNKTIDSINVYMDDVLVTEGVENISTDAEAVNVCPLAYATDAKTTFTVGVVIGGVEYKASAVGKKNDGYLKATATQDNEVLIDWHLTTSGTKPYGSVNYDYTNKADGTRSLRINLNSHVSSGEAGRNIKLITNDVYPAGTYSLKYKIMKTTNSTPKIYSAGWDIYNQTVTLSQDEALTLLFRCDDSNTAYWIDDIELYAITDGNVTGDNLLKNGSFESMPTPNSYTWGFAEYYGTQLEKIEQDYGEVYYAYLNIANNTTEEGINAYLIAVVRKNGKITSVKYSPTATNVPLGQTKELSLEIAVDEWNQFDTEANNYEVSVFAWDGLDTMVPVTTPAKYTD